MVVPDSPAEITITTNEKDFRCMLTRQSDIRVEPEEVQLAGLTVSQQSKQDVGNYQESLHIRRIMNEPTMTLEVIHQPDSTDVRIYQTSIDTCFEDRPRIFNLPSLHYKHAGGDMIETRAGTIP